MPKGTTFDTDLLALLFNATAMSLAQNNATANGNLFISLHTADPSGGNQNTSEAAYTSYARVAVVRTSGGWTVSGNNVVNAANITFPACTGGSANVTYVGIGQNNTGVGGEIYYSGALTASLNISNGITPQFNSGNLKVTES